MRHYILFIVLCTSCATISAQLIVGSVGSYYTPRTESNYNAITGVVSFPILKPDQSVSLTAVGRFIPEFETINLSVGVQKSWEKGKMFYLLNPQFVMGLYGGKTTTSFGFTLYQRISIGKVGLNCFWQENWNDAGHLNGTLTFDLDYLIYNKDGILVTAGLSVNLFNHSGLADLLFDNEKSTVSIGPVISAIKLF